MGSILGLTLAALLLAALVGGIVAALGWALYSLGVIIWEAFK